MRDEILGDPGFVPRSPIAQKARDARDAQCKCPMGTRHTCAERTEDVSFLTDDERRFFAYMAEQRFRTVSEMDPEKREAARRRWQEVALWFVPTWQGDNT